MNSTGLIRVGIVDDESLACEEMKRLLDKFDDLQIEFVAHNAEETIEYLHEIEIDLIFLDIGLPGISGLHLAGLLAKEECKIVFCTADSSHALKAFELNAIDYLHKPIELNRLSKTLEKYRALVGISRGAPGSNHIDMEKPILINSGDKTELFTPKQIELVCSIGNYVKLKGDGLNVVAHYTMSYMESRLSGRIFFRANRSTLVNLSKVEKVDFSPSGNYILIMSSGEEVSVSRRQCAQMKNMFKL